MRILVLFLGLIPGVVFAQINLDFESGTLNEWILPSEFIWGLDSIEPISGIYSLKHIYDNSEAGIDVASLPLGNLSIEGGPVSWSFRLRHAYNPSSSNSWAVLLATDQALRSELKFGAVNGVILGVNLNGYDDTLRLWCITEGQLELIASTSINWQNDIGTEEAPLLVVQREPGGSWQVLIERPGYNRQVIGTGNSNTLFLSDYLGIYYKYTSSCDRLLWIDDISVSGIFIIDTLEPILTDVSFTDNRSLRIIFDEPISQESIVPGNFILMPDSILPHEVIIEDSRCVRICYSKDFVNKDSYDLILTGLCDNWGNCLDTLMQNLVYFYPEWGDLIITEIMPDPEPAIGLPGVEYFEVYNRSDLPINLNTVSFQNGSSSVLFPDYLLKPGEYLAVCNENDTFQFAEDIALIGLKSLPVFNNSADLVLLTEQSSGTLHGVDYQDSWRNNHFKNDGGWSFEMIDPAYPFSGPGNWTFSTDIKGGTPGSRNSVDKSSSDIKEPFPTNCFPLTPFELKLDFSEPVKSAGRFAANLSIDGIDIISLSRIDSLRMSYNVSLADKLSYGLVYSLYFDNISDYGDNDLDPEYFRFGLPEKAMPSDVVINEVMFEPMSGYPEFIEFFNRSDRIIDAGSLFITSINLSSGDTSSISYLSNQPRCFLPGEYFAITEDKNALVRAYYSSDPDRIFEVNNLPSLPDNEGRVLLLYKDLTIIDDFTYYDHYHLDLISGSGGVSLERISPDVATNQENNWQSATGLSGWATPGSENSVNQIFEGFDKSSVSLSSSRISPDGDGYEDMLTINLKLDGGEWIIDLIVYDDMGFRVNSLYDNSTASGSEIVYWDGTDDYGRLVESGIYIIFIKAVSPSGEVRKWKKVCSVLRR